MMMRDDMPEGFVGVFIPAEIWACEDSRLTWMMKVLWAEIYCLGRTVEKPCTATNDHIAKMLGSSASSVANMISDLVRLGLVCRVSPMDKPRAIIAVTPTSTSGEGFTCGLRGGSPSGEGGVHPAVKGGSPSGEHSISLVNNRDNNNVPELALETENQSTQQPPKAKPKVRNEGLIRMRLCSVMKRSYGTPWSKSEEKALAHMKSMPVESLDNLSEYYSHSGEPGFFCRQNMITLLNNLSGEIDKADRWKREGVSKFSSGEDDESNRIAKMLR